MDSLELQESLFLTIEIIAQNKIDLAKYDKTITATILECTNSITGEYLVLYLDIKYKVYSQNSYNYLPGLLVYILVPNGDFSAVLSIICSAEIHNDIVYTLGEEEKHLLISNNLLSKDIINNNKNYISSYSVKDSIDLILSDIILDKTIIRKGNCLKLEAEFITDLDYKLLEDFPYYGIKIDLEFDFSGIKKIVTFDFNSLIMTGTPLKYGEWTKLYFIFNGIDLELMLFLSSVKSIKFYKSGFKIKENNSTLYDIGVRNILLYVIKLLSEDVLNTNFLSLYLSDENRIEAKLWYNKNYIFSKDITYYWFEDNADIDINSEYYSKVGGVGRKLLLKGTNNYYIIEENHNLESITCIAEYREEKFEKELEIKLNEDLQLISSTGLFTYRDNKIISITCNYDKLKKYNYVWTYIYSTGEKKTIGSHDDDNDDSKKNNLTSISINTNLSINYIICSCEVDGKKITKKISRKLDSPKFTLILNNKNQVFNYDLLSNSNTTDQLQIKIQGKPLSFVLLDENLNEVTLGEDFDIEWRIPTVNTLFEFTNNDNEYPGDNASDVKYKIIKDRICNFGLTENFDHRKINNDITLHIYNSSGTIDLYEKTNFIIKSRLQRWENDASIYRISFSLYGKIPEEGENGIFEIDESYRMAYAISGYYHCLVGKLESKLSGENWKDITNNITYTWRILNRNNNTLIVKNESGLIDNKFYFIARGSEDLNLPYENIILLELLYKYNDLEKYFTSFFPLVIGNKKSNIKELNFGYQEVLYDAVGLNPKFDSSNDVGGFTPPDYYDGEGFNYYRFLKIDDTHFHVPIYLYLNRYGQSYLDNWNGAAISIHPDSSSYISSTTIGTGKRELDGSFTGTIMGEMLEDGGEKSTYGLFGYKKGFKTFELNSETGDAIFSGTITCGEKETGKYFHVTPDGMVEARGIKLLSGSIGNIGFDESLGDVFTDIDIKDNNNESVLKTKNKSENPVTLSFFSVSKDKLEYKENENLYYSISKDKIVAPKISALLHGVNNYGDDSIYIITGSVSIPSLSYKILEYNNIISVTANVVIDTDDLTNEDRVIVIKNNGVFKLGNPQNKAITVNYIITSKLE